MDEREYTEKSDAESRRYFVLVVSIILLLISGIVFVANFWSSNVWATLLGSLDIIFCILAFGFHWWAEHKVISRK